MWQIQLGNQRRTSNGITCLGCCYCCCCTCPNKWQKTGQKLCICSSLLPVHNFVFPALFSCTFAAAAVRVQSAICCGCDLANCLQEKQKAKTIQLSPNNPTTATMTTTTTATTTKARNRLWPGAIYIARHFASSPCPDGAIVSGCASDSGSCSDSCRLLPHASHYPALSALPLLVCRSKVERSSNCLPGVFTAASGFFPQLFDL